MCGQCPSKVKQIYKVTLVGRSVFSPLPASCKPGSPLLSCSQSLLWVAFWCLHRSFKNAWSLEPTGPVARNLCLKNSWTPLAPVPQTKLSSANYSCRFCNEPVGKQNLRKAVKKGQQRSCQRERRMMSVSHLFHSVRRETKFSRSGSFPTETFKKTKQKQKQCEI